jgi:uncharacterized protein YndB with AHSA1/START domain
MAELTAPRDTPADELRFTRTFDAPRALVFECMTDPAHLTHFWGPAGTSAPHAHIRVDARPGGVFETLMVNDADGSEYPTRAVYDEVRPPELLIWTEAHSGMTVRIDFVEQAPGRTEVRIHQTRVPEAMRAPEAQQGFLTALDRFAAYLAGLTGKQQEERSGR